MQLTPSHVFYLFVMFIEPQVHPRVTSMRFGPRWNRPEVLGHGTLTSGWVNLLEVREVHPRFLARSRYEYLS
jgi:hypothetical protein